MAAPFSQSDPWPLSQPNAFDAEAGAKFPGYHEQRTAEAPHHTTEGTDSDARNLGTARLPAYAAWRECAGNVRASIPDTVEEVTFKGGTFGTRDAEEEWALGDGSPGVKTRSEGNVKPLAEERCAVLKHAFAKPGLYLVRARRTDRFGQTAAAFVDVRVGQE